MRILGHDPADVAARWRERARRLRDGERPPTPPGTPPAELHRTPAAARVGELAVAEGLFSFHFERRVVPPLPSSWVAEGAEDLAEPSTWERGVLAEQKYQSFRLDLPVASFHPHHRAKWSAHELCHKLVGFAWRADATPFFHATASRLAELLPVALWYFLDEPFLRRCPDHQGDGDLYRTHCARCEALAGPWPEDPDAEARIAEGLRYVEKELAAVARSRREGRPIPHRHGTLDLASDGVAYAIAHGLRLGSDAFRTYAERFLVTGGGWSPDLEHLEARVLDVLAGILGDRAPAPLAPSPAHGRWRWILQDVGYRLLHLAEDADRKVARRLDALSRTLAEAIPATVDPTADPEAAARAALQAVIAELERPDGPGAADVFGLGYRVEGLPEVPTPLHEGIESAFPQLAALLDTDLPALVGAFERQDGFERRSLPDRFAAWLADQYPGAVADLAAWEAAVAAVPPVPPPRLDGPPADARRRLAPGVRVLRVDHDVLGLAARVDRGEVDGTFRDGVLRLVVRAGGPVEPTPTGLVVAREPDGELLVLDVDPAAAEALLALPPAGGVPDLPDDERASLEDFGVLVPAAFREVTG